MPHPPREHPFITRLPSPAMAVEGFNEQGSKIIINHGMLSPVFLGI
jgi:hypothetical protein